MVRSTIIAAMASAAAANQFVMYTTGGDDVVVERVDPIVNWGNISAHVHQVFGADGLKPDMTYDSLQDSGCTNVGSAQGKQNTADMSVYWHPSLYMEAKDGSGYVRVPIQSHKLYYRDTGNAADKLNEPFEFPKGYRALAGFPTQRSPKTDGIHVWQCYQPSGTITGENGQFPQNFESCDTIPGFQVRINFPHCWNGKDFDENNPDAHYSYPDGDCENGPCPASHPIRIPHIFSENIFDLKSVQDKTIPGSFVLSNGDKTGCGYHADFFNGWKSGAIPELFETCPQGEYGNHDIGTCPTFAAGPDATQCKQTGTFKEEVDTPGQYLPGCNPIVDTDPAPKMAVAPLGVCTAECPKAGSGHASSGSSPPSYNSGSSGSSSGSNSAPAAVSQAAAPAYNAPAVVAPVQESEDGSVVWVTEVVTVTGAAGGAAPTAPTYQAPAAGGAAPAYKRHEHMEKHRAHARSL
ncbi:hypothetical protein TI39_contig505g00013 [Zymoseptoria brevis]|uniref:DUF1996 domain-containing protein n=1 Tax=Zymoseptoria brevis TaxID=1047168 RepID=A0A0F4GIT4_9PEZI|nr:hypothetical protein TI39_contig505g00013 [Zymoseptoria brevis]